MLRRGEGGGHDGATADLVDCATRPRRFAHLLRHDKATKPGFDLRKIWKIRNI